MNERYPGNGGIMSAQMNLAWARAHFEEFWLDAAAEPMTAVWAGGATLLLILWRRSIVRRKAQRSEIRALQELVEEIRKRLLAHRNELLESVAQHKRFQSEMNEHAIKELKLFNERLARLEQSRGQPGQSASLHPAARAAPVAGHDIHALKQRLAEIEVTLEEGSSSRLGRHRARNSALDRLADEADRLREEVEHLSRAAAMR